MDEKPSILKQVTGAIVGGTIALVAYYAYDLGAPVVTAWLIQPGYEAELGHSTIADRDTDSTDARRIQAQARRIAANTRPVPEYSQYTPPSVSSSSSSAPSSPSSSSVMSSSTSTSSEAVDSIWEQAWGEDVDYKPVQSAQGEPVPALPDSGFGVWALVGTAGATVGSQYRRLWRRKRK